LLCHGIHPELCRIFKSVFRDKEKSAQTVMGIKNQQKRGNVAALEPGIVSSLSFSATGGQSFPRKRESSNFNHILDFRFHGNGGKREVQKPRGFC